MSDADDRDRGQLRTVADYQFGAGAGAALFPTEERLRIDRTSSGRPSQVHAETGRVVTYAVDGRFTLGVEGGRRLVERFDTPTYRVVVGDESEPFVRDGKNAFAKFVREVDAAVRPGDEVAVVDGSDALLAVGRAELSGETMTDFKTGMAVKVRSGVGTPDSTDE